MPGKFRFAIDRGGTFTDVYAECPNGRFHTLKLLSVDPENYSDAPREGIRRILEQETGVKVPKNERIDGSNIEWIRMGTTIATNALLERKGERMALVINRGFKDLLHIGNQARPDIFDLEITVPEVLYEEVVEVDCRIIPEMADRCALPEAKSWPVLSGLSDERYLYCTPLNEDNLRTQLKSVLARGIKSIAVVLMHSYMYHEHEIIIGQLAAKLGFTNVSLSHQVMPMVKIVSRGFTASTDAYLTPHIKKYVKGFASGFVNDLDGVNVLFMQSDGGLTPMHKFNGSRAILSGPAGGVVGYATTTPGTNPVIGFDMGGTSTDVSRFDGSYEHVFETTVAGVTIQSPQLDINTVAAGGGSRLFFRSGLFVVGPESAGAHPGPVCYRKGGYLTITDANLVLGRIVPDYFPKIFGPDEKQPLDKETTVKKFEELRDEINEFLQSQNRNAELLSVEKVAMGFIRVANEAMCRPIRALTQGKGYDVTKHTLACFGGAGGQHACAIARELGISQVAIHKYAGILSAYGMACADVVHEEQEPCSLVFSSENFPSLEAKISALQKTCAQKLEELGFSKRNIVCEPFLNLRYDGTDNCLMCSSADDAKTLEGFKNAFINRYQKEYGFTMKERKILVDDVRVRGIGKSARISENSSTPERSEPSFDKVVSIYFDKYGFVASNVYLSERLKSGQMIKGPALIMDGLSTTLIEPDSEASVTSTGNLLIDVDTVVSSRIGTDLDTIQLSIFSHRFMSIAEQMGRVLQRTAISTNIKERLDFSCALFGPDGGVVSNAPHIPVHLGSMQEAVQFQMTSLGGEIREGDVILSNHPQAGGTHLPDLTVITPVFYNGTSRPVFFVASRGHHADIGGITPGSMPPHSKSLDQEGATFKSFFLVRDGVFREKDVIDELMKPGDIPGSSGTRNLQDNLADLKAQIAANQKGINLVKDLIDHYGLDVVQAYMSHIQQNASVAVQNVLKTIGKQELDKQGKSELFCSDFMDDGSPICLRIAINIDNGNAVFDFTGSGFEVWGNCNAPKAITMSAIIYCLRCIVGQNIPLNQGCLAPIKTIIPVGSILNPSPGAAVVGGNVQTSQRIVDVILKAFKACADSQGCMNNVTFGQKDWGYYETIAGGGGAGPTWNGRSGIHTHMTNTRITDPEILEKRYPVVLEAFKLRENSGGEGQFKGGDGIERKLKFRNHIALSILTERRVFSPCGLNGGSNGARGINLMHKTDGRIIYLASKTAIDVEPGDSLQVLTPGGGGWGAAKGQEDFSDSKIKNKKTSTPKFFEKGSLADFSKAQYSA